MATRRTVRAQAQTQKAQRAAGILSQTGEVKTFIDPTTGKDTRTFDPTTGQPIAGTGTMTTQKIQGPLGMTPEARSGLVSQALSQGLTSEQRRASGIQTSAAPAMGVIEKSARERIAERRPDLTPEQVEEQLKQSKAGAREVFTGSGLGQTMNQGRIIEIDKRLSQMQQEDKNVEQGQGAPDTPEVRAERQKERTELEKEKTELIKQQKELREQVETPGGAPPPTGTSAGGKVDISSIFPGVPPEIASAYLPSILGAEGQKADATDTFNAIMEGIAQDRQFSAQIFQQGLQSATEQRERQIQFDREINELQRERDMEIQRKNFAEVDQQEKLFELETRRAEALQRDANIESELQNRRLAAKLGINFDTGGLQWMQDQVRKGKETLEFLIQRAAIEHKSFSNKRIEIANEFGLNMKAVDLESRKDYAQAWKDYNDTLGDLKKNSMLDRKEMRKEEQAAAKSYGDRLYDIDTKTTEAYRDMQLKAFDHYTATKKEESKKWQDDFDNAIQYINTFPTTGAESKDILRNFEKNLDLPSGSLSGAKSFEELRMIKGNGGMAGVSDLVELERNRVSQAYPNALPKTIDSLVYSNLSQKFDTKGERALYTYMTTNPLGDIPYSLPVVFTPTQAGDVAADALQRMENQSAIESGDLTPNELFNELTDKNLPDKFRMTKAEADKYIEDIGYVRVPNIFLPRSRESFRKK